MKKYEILLALSAEDPHHPLAIRLFLEEKGYQVTMATSSGSAIETVQRNHFDLLITDLLVILEKAKELNPNIMAILVLGTRSQSIPTAHAIRSPPDDYLFKPLELTELEMRVAHCIEKIKHIHGNPQNKWCKQGLDEKTLNLMKVLSHDFRGSLVSISATLKLLNRGYYGKMEDGVANNLKELLLKTTGLIKITEEYLDKIFEVDGGLETKDAPLDLKQDIISPVLEELSPELKDHSILIDHRLEAMANKPISIKVNSICLKTVFRNLLKNAIKYGEKGCRIVLGFEDQGSSYRLNVYNSGEPIPEEWRNKLFSKFVRFGNNGGKDRREDGMGLGLYLIKKIIQKQGGDIWYEPREDGSNFVFTVPHS